MVHSGEALFYYTQQFNELSGRGVILIHRLTKNSVTSVTYDEYTTITELAYSDIEFPNQMEVQKGIETYEHFWNIKTLEYVSQ